ncbi:uncharacterized protein P174DRAFT_418808 [Aspergillus novofumigatus IBT 16806]|uniref:Uncharacterized protein n=1 Tax=Aspergillus novofumigatus (strain IBT 16806) TaxID=1392255 RepID=A0A2I1CB34_ASPN1|nr:uncharacterized protein P174DRAFT_418808 [Aspergillus novofumigatus IBT 16806]PKX94830.1 hypothetical protein P174DRAFT_418808 [Aspergillus novofumigatus IBT 16806]
MTCGFLVALASSLPLEYVHKSRHSWWGFPFFELGLQLEPKYDKWEPWVVKLEFALDGEPGQPAAGSNSEAEPNDIPRIGSGFYLNINGATYRGGQSTNRAHLPAQTTRSVSRSVLVMVERPSEKDWGAAIFFPRDAHKANTGPAGFDFNLLYGEEGDERQDLIRELSKSGMTRGGYTDGAELGEPRTSGVQDVHPTRFSLRYKSATNQGISGSPIWGLCEERSTVIEIQGSQTSEGRGVRLSSKFLQEIFSWASVGYCSKVLRAHNRPAFADGLYKRFPEYADFSLVHLGKDGLNTKL